MSLVPAHYNFTVYQGATFYKRIFFKVDGELQDLTGYTAELVVKEEPEAVTDLITLTSSPAAGITLGGKEGTIDLEVTDEETTLITWEVGVYELFITDASSRTDVLLRGNFKVILF